MSAQRWLEEAIVAHGAVAGTVHVVAGDDLALIAHVRIPPPVLAKVANVPHGKGMAGVAQTRREPVQTCNLQTDTSGVVKPTAKLVAANAAIAVPVLRDDVVVGIVGFAFGYEGEIPEAEVRAMAERAASVPLPEPEPRGIELLLGDWRIAYAIAPDGRLYDGAVRIERDGDDLRLRWALADGERVDVGVWADGAAIATHGGDAVALYVDGGSAVAGRWRSADGGGVEAVDVRRVARRHGVGLAADGWAGVGLRRGNLLGVARSVSGNPGAMWLEPTPTGLSARWVDVAHEGLGRVLLER